MKIRNGFVSNSSSSSFIVAFPHEPVDAADVHSMLWGKSIDQPFNMVVYGDYHLDSAEAATWIFEDITNQRTGITAFEERLDDAIDGVEQIPASKIEAILGKCPDKDIGWEYYDRKQALEMSVGVYHQVNREIPERNEAGLLLDKERYAAVCTRWDDRYAELTQQRRQELLKQFAGKPAYCSTMATATVTDTMSCWNGERYLPL